MPFCDHSRRLHAVMAGNGNPYDILSVSSLRILRALHESPSLEDVAAALQLSHDELAVELEPLRQASLLTEVGGGLRPNLLVATAHETERVDAHATVMGRQLAGRLKERQAAIQQAFNELTASTSTPLRDLAFVLIGDRILDVGLLDALARERTLMQAAPARPSPSQPDARYYFWLIEGTHDQLGRYGQRTTGLTGDGWEILTFGQYTIDDDPNVARDLLEQVARDYLASDSSRTPENLGRFLGIPVVDRTDAGKWWSFVRECADDLLQVYVEAEGSLRELYATLAASSYLDDGFGEFFCWYDHVAYAHAIDALAEADVLTIPDQRFSAAVWRDPLDASEF